jgi:hypothetical protein
MASNFAQTIDATPAVILVAENETRPFFIQIIGNNTVYVGDSASVSSTNGFPVVKHSAPVQMMLMPGMALYGVCAAGQTEEIRVFAPRD